MKPSITKRSNLIRDIFGEVGTIKYIVDGYCDFLTDDELLDYSNRLVTISDELLTLIQKRETELRKTEMEANKNGNEKLY